MFVVRVGRSSASRWRELLVCTRPGTDFGWLGSVGLPQVAQGLAEVIEGGPELAGGGVEGRSVDQAPGQCSRSACRVVLRQPAGQVHSVVEQGANLLCEQMGAVQASIRQLEKREPGRCLMLLRVDMANRWTNIEVTLNTGMISCLRRRGDRHGPAQSYR